MSFKINDYNAFLTSLFDKNNTNPNSQTPSNANGSQQQQSQQRLLQPNSTAAAAAFQAQQHQLQAFASGGNMDDANGSFPVDFEFGLIPPQQQSQQQTQSHQSSLSSDGSSPTYNNRSKSINYPIISQQQPQHPHPQQSQLQNEYIPDMSNGMSPPMNNKQFSPNQQQQQQQQQSQILSQSDNLFPLSYMATYDTHSDLVSPLNNPGQNGGQNDLLIKQEPLYSQQQQQILLQQQQQQQQSNQQQNSQVFVKQEDESNSLSPLSSNQSPWNNNINQHSQFQPIPPPVQPIITKVRSNNSVSGTSNGRQKSTYSFDGSSPVSSTTTLHNGPGRPRVKSAHNVIEQRYRNKINDKFTALQESVPTLKILARRKQRQLLRQQENGGNGDEDLDSSEEDNDFDGHGYGDDPNEEIIDLEGLEPARKLNKGTILAKSIEYIKFLELKNDRIRQENNELVLKARMLGIQFDAGLINDDSRR
ncbi:hypothetical protein DFJ63DRAFT_312317 [Scheffersomyces coipomensis]|uniref:uncharacterized protein n=1 Tax=Scheffersomyces coipomensis TaxID=1788519 RepID=UPI00315CBDFD